MSTTATPDLIATAREMIRLARRAIDAITEIVAAMAPEDGGRSAFVVQYARPADAPGVWQTIPVAYDTLEAAVEASVAHCEACIAPGVDLARTGPDAGGVVVLAGTANDTGEQIDYRIEPMSLVPHPADGPA